MMGTLDITQSFTVCSELLFGLLKAIFHKPHPEAGSLFLENILYTVYPSRIKCITYSINETLLLIMVSNEMSHNRHYNTLDELFTT